MSKLYEVCVEMENRCHLNCLHCSSYDMRQSKIDYNYSDLINFFQIFDSRLHVYLTGGEPLINSNLSMLINEIKEISPQVEVGIFTCGICENLNPIDFELAKKLKISGLDDSYVSLYHFNSKKHDKITALSGSHKTTCKTIENLLKAGIEVKIHLVINSLNYLEIPEIIKYLLEHQVSQVRLLRIVKTGNAADNWEFVGVPYEAQNMVIQKIMGTIDCYSSKLTISGFPEQVACRPFPGAQKCQAGTHVLYICSNGNVYPCACTKNFENLSIGNISNLEPIRKYLNTQKVRNCNEHCLNPIS